MERLRNWWDKGRAASRRLTERLWAAARNPLRVLPVLVVIALLAIALPLTVTGLGRVGRAALDWRQDSTTTWHRTTARVDQVRIDDGLVLDLAFRDRHDERHEVHAYVGDAEGKWVGRSVRIRYESGDADNVQVLGIEESDPIPQLLLAGAPLGAGIAGLVLAVSLWRRRKLVAVSAHPLEVMRSALVVAGCILVAGIATWAVGTVWERGWSAVASAVGDVVATIFSDLLGVLVPLVAFALGCLVTAWLARHRRHPDDDGIISSAYRMIDRAASMAPSPDQLRPGPTESETASASEARREAESGTGTPDPTRVP
jgi:hypothetical protein